MDIIVSELFDKIEKEPSREGKLTLLRKYNTNIVKAVLHMNYEKTVKFFLPEGEPPFNKDKNKPIGYNETTLLLELKRFYIWLRPDVNLSPTKKESLFINMLEGLHYTEAELICLVKDKKLSTKYKSLTLDLVKEAFPDIVFNDPLIEEPPVKPSLPKKSRKAARVS